MRTKKSYYKGQGVDDFNSCDIEMITELYAYSAVNHQVANKPATG